MPVTSVVQEGLKEHPEKMDSVWVPHRLGKSFETSLDATLINTSSRDNPLLTDPWARTSETSTMNSALDISHACYQMLGHLHTLISNWSHVFSQYP